MGTIQIKSGVNTTNAKFIHTETGAEIQGVSACDIRMRLDERVGAFLSFELNGLDVEAEPLLSFETVNKMAKYYGCSLIMAEHSNI